MQLGWTAHVNCVKNKSGGSSQTNTREMSAIIPDSHLPISVYTVKLFLLTKAGMLRNLVISALQPATPCHILGWMH